MGCGASTAGPPSAKYAAAPDGENLPPDAKGDGKAAYLSKLAVRKYKPAKYDVVMSFDPSFSPELYKLVSDELSKDYSVGPRGVKSIQSASKLVIFLSPSYFASKDCCNEFCEVVKTGVEVVLVCVDGSEWAGMPFPQLTDLPETMGAVRPRAAGAVLFGHTIAIEHRNAYLGAFVEKLRQRLGPSGKERAMLKAAKAGPKLDRRNDIDASEIRFDAFLSHKRSEAQDTVARCHDKLVDLGYRAFIDRNDLVELPSLKLAVRDTATFVAFLTPNYFQSAWCCLELVQAVETKVPVLFVVVDGASWPKGGAFPVPADVPETIVVHDEEDITLQPRKAFAAIHEAAPRMVQKRAFFSSLIDGLQDSLGPPPAVAALEGEAKEIWSAAGGGTKLGWPTVRAQLKSRGGPGYTAAEVILSKALGVREVNDSSASVSAVAFAALFQAGTDFKATVEALGGSDASERVLPVVVVPPEEGQPDADGGLALVGSNTSLSDVRSQLVDAYDEEKAADELLKTGRFTFLATAARKAVRRKQEKLIRGTAIDNPVCIRTDKNAKAAVTGGEEVAESAADASKSKAAQVAKDLIAAGARRDADLLDLDEVMRDSARAASLRRHAAAAASDGKPAGPDTTAARAEAEGHAQVAILTLALNDALATGDVGKSVSVAEQLRGLVKKGVGSVPLAADASPQQIADAMRNAEMASRLALRPALERMRAEMIKAATGGAIKGGAKSASGLKRVVVLGGGPCGASVAYNLVHQTEGFHVTVVDTKEYYEDTPSVLRMMTADDMASYWGHLNINFADILRDSPKAEYINGAAVAVRKDHILVGTTSGIASRVVPFDYLVLSTGTRYQSDIKTEGASIAHRKRSFEIERERMKDCSSFALIGAGLVGIELATDLKSYFPDKKVIVYTKAGGWLPRIQGAHEMVDAEVKAQGVDLVVGQEIVGTDEDGRLVNKQGEKMGEPGARVYWCTGYKPNSDYLQDERTDPDIRAELDALGFVKVDRAHRLNPEKGLGHILCGGDLAWAPAHSHGERTGAGAWYHCGAIVENIRFAAGLPQQIQMPGTTKPEGCWKQVALNNFPGAEGLAVSLGNNAGFLYATDPMFEAFYHDKEGMRAKYGDIKEVGPGGWKEVTKGKITDMGSINWLMFHLVPDGAYNMFTKDDMSTWNMFVNGSVIQDLGTVGRTPMPPPPPPPAEGETPPPAE